MASSYGDLIVWVKGSTLGNIWLEIMVCRTCTTRSMPNIWEPHIFLSNLSWLRFQVFYNYTMLDRLWASWVSRHPVDSHFVKKIDLFFVCCLTNCSLNCSFEQALKHILDSHFSNSGWKPDVRWLTVKVLKYVPWIYGAWTALLRLAISTHPGFYTRPYDITQVFLLDFII